MILHESGVFMLTISNKGWLFTSILSALMAFTSLSTDIYLPAMPEMGRDLNGDAELTLTGFLIGFALAQLFWGAVSDKIGRKKPLIMGSFIYHWFCGLCIEFIHDGVAGLARVPGLWCLCRTYVITGYDSRLIRSD